MVAMITTCVLFFTAMWDIANANPCSINNGNCFPPRTCSNVNGKAVCDDCPKGFTEVGPLRCERIKTIKKAGDYVAKDKGKTSCSEGTPITTEEECKKKAGPQFNGFKQTLDFGHYPKGCFIFISTRLVFWNDHANGKANPGASPVCYTGTKTTKAPMTTKAATKAPIATKVAKAPIAVSARRKLKLAHNDKQCDRTQGEIFMSSSKQTLDLDACLDSCTSAPACRSVTYYPSGYCSHFITHCTKTEPAVGAKSYTMVDNRRLLAGSKYLDEKCSEGAMTSPGLVFHADFCSDLCAQSKEGCTSITFAKDGYCSFFTSDCSKRTSLSGAVSFQVKPFSTRAVYDMTDCADCSAGLQFIPQTSGYVLTLEECLLSCSRNPNCEGTTFYYDGFCSHVGKPTNSIDKWKKICYKKKPKGPCFKDNGGCDSKRTCTEVNGAAKCEDCPAGYVNDGAKGCKDVDECAKNNGGCDSKRKCTNTEGSFKCEDCDTGYVNDGAKGCKDDDECAKNNGGCDSKRKCTNSVGSFKCEDCPAGYVNDGAKGCKDVDECAKNNGGCDSKRKCENTPGSFKCGECDAGYKKFGDKQCKRKNPCKDSGHMCDSANRGGCHIKRTCDDKTGSIVCGPCPAGFINDGDKNCKEINWHQDMVCDVDDGEVWNKEVDTDTWEDCKKSCIASNYCLSVTYYHHGGCSHWSSMCKKYVKRERVRSKNVKGESLNKKECDASNGEVWEAKLHYWVSVDQCRATCMSRDDCNAFTYYNHGGCSFFSSCCHNTRIVENAHSERWRLP